MADRVLFIGWSTPVRGREERGLEVFNESIGQIAVSADCRHVAVGLTTGVVYVLRLGPPAARAK